MSPYKNGTLPKVKSISVFLVFLAALASCQLGDNRMHGKISSSGAATLEPPVNLVVTNTWIDRLALNWQPPSATVSAYRVTYAMGSVAPESCAGGVVVASPSFILDALVSDQEYSFAICSLDLATGEMSPLLAVTSHTLKAVSLSEVYVGNSNWNTYVDNDGLDPYSGTNTACSGAVTGFLGCLHGGEIRKVEVPTLASCGNYVARDSLGVFNWICQDSGTVTFYSTGLRLAKGLRDLLDGDGWFENHLIVGQPGQDEFATLMSSSWWTNPIEPLPPGSGALSTPGTIYYLAADRTDDTHELADGVAVVTAPGVVLTGGATSYVFHAFGKNYFWIEADVSSTANPSISVFVGSHFRIINSAVRNQPIYVSNASRFRIINTKVIDSLSNGIELNSSNQFQVAHVSTANSAQRGVYVSGGTENSFVNITNINNGDSGIEFIGSSPVTVSGILSSSNKGYALRYFPGGTASHLTSFNDFRGFYASSKADILLNQFLRYGHSSLVLNLNSVDSSTFSQIAISDPGEGITSTTSDNNKYTNNILLAGAPTCTSSGGTNPGLDSSCNLTDASDGVRRTVLSPASSFFGEVSFDATNAHGGVSLTAYASITDWLNFDNIFRVWGRSGYVYPSVNLTDQCNAGDCQIWDLRLKSGASDYLNKSYDGLNSNLAFVAGQTCPPAVDGDYTLTDEQAPANTFLVNATEILFDFEGDDDGLCENNESCIYSPNFGFYQGEGDYRLQGTCTFQDGSGGNPVTGVKMFAYPVNGA